MSERREPDWVRGAPSDVLRAVVALASLAVVLLIGGLFDQTIVAGAARLFEGLGNVPAWVFDAAELVAAVLLAVLLGAGLVIVLTGRHWRLLADAVVAGALAIAGSVLISHAVDAAAKVAPESDLVPVDGRIPSAAVLATATAVVVVAATAVPRIWRRSGWTLVLILFLLRVVGAPLSFDAFLAVLTGWASGSLVVALLGAPSRRPTVASILAGLVAVGVELDRIEPASVDARGSTPYFGHTAEGSRYFVKVLGGDERSADLMFRVWRFLQPRNFGDQLPFSSLRRGVEHEALVAIMARQLGVRTPPVAGVATADPDGSVLVYEAISGRSLDELTVEEISDDVLAQAWSQLAVMRRHRLAHRDLRLANLFLDSGGSLFLIDFGFSELAAEDLLLQTDIVELLASSAVVVGVERSVRAAREGVGRDAVADAAPLLVPSRLSGATRSAMRSSPGLLGALRSAAC